MQNRMRVSNGQDHDDHHENVDNSRNGDGTPLEIFPAEKPCTNVLQFYCVSMTTLRHKGVNCFHMKLQKFAVGLTILNLLLLASNFLRPNIAASPDPAPASILRCRELYLMDDKGRVRAELKITPPDPNVKMPDGTRGFPESVLFRMFSSEGAPYVKLGAAEDGGGMVLGGDKSYTQALSRGANPFIKIVNKDGREQTIKP